MNLMTSGNISNASVNFIDGQTYTFNQYEFLYMWSQRKVPTTEQIELCNNIFANISDQPLNRREKLLQKKGGAFKFGRKFKYYEYFTKDTEAEIGIEKGIEIPSPSIFHLPMGMGKTTMITPLLIIKLISVIESNNSNDNIYIILPDSLVRQSVDIMRKHLSYLQPINVFEITESREDLNEIPVPDFQELGKKIKTFDNLMEFYKIYENYIQKCIKLENSLSFTNSLKNRKTLYILSDTSLKCGLLNNYQKLFENSNRNYYIIDEGDTVLNPTTSELNYPLGKKNFINTFVYIYDFINNIYMNVNKFNPPEFKDIWFPQYKKVIIDDVNFNIAIKNWFFKYAVNYFNDRSNPNLRELNKLGDINLTVGDINKPIFGNGSGSGSGNGSSNINAPPDSDKWYIIYNLRVISEFFGITFQLTDRVNYGLTPQFPVIIPFDNLEKPSKGCQFSNPLMVMCLTIMSIQNLKQTLVSSEGRVLSDITLSGFMTFIKKLAKEEQYISDLIKDMGININGFFNSVQRMELITNPVLIAYYYRQICYSNIRFYSSQLMAMGTDLFDGKYFKKCVAFTGTTESIIPWTDNIGRYIKPQDMKPKHIEYMNNGIYVGVVDIIGIYVNGTSVDTVKEIIYNQSGLKSINTLIDCNGFLIGFTVNQLAQILKEFKAYNKKNKKYEYIVYWNQQDVNMIYTIDSGVERIWNQEPDDRGNEIFYFYDHQHTTGTDAKIPLSSLGAIIVKPNCTYRDFIQSAFRMRKLGEGVDENGGHRLNIYISQNIKTKPKPISKDQFVQLITNNGKKQWIADEQLTNQHLQIAKNRFETGTNSINFEIPNIFNYDISACINYYGKISVPASNYLRVNQEIVTDVADVEVQEETESQKKMKTIAQNADNKLPDNITIRTFDDLLLNANIIHKKVYTIAISRISTYLSDSVCVFIKNNNIVIGTFYDYLVLSYDKSIDIFSFSNVKLSGDGQMIELDNILLTIISRILLTDYPLSDKKLSEIYNSKYREMIELFA